MADSGGDAKFQVRETFEVLQEISQLLNTGLDSETLAICLRLCENGIEPAALAGVVKGLREFAATSQNAHQAER